MTQPPNWWQAVTARELLAIRAAEDWYLDKVLRMQVELDRERARADEWQNIATELRKLIP